MSAGHLIEWVFDLAGDEGFADFYFLAAFPPVCAASIKDVLGSWLGWGLAGELFLYLLAYGFFFSGLSNC